MKIVKESLSNITHFKKPGSKEDFKKDLNVGIKHILSEISLENLMGHHPNQKRIVKNIEELLNLHRSNIYQIIGNHAPMDDRLHNIFIKELIDKRNIKSTMNYGAGVNLRIYNTSYGEFLQEYPYGFNGKLTIDSIKLYSTFWANFETAVKLQIYKLMV